MGNCVFWEDKEANKDDKYYKQMINTLKEKKV